MDNTSFSTELDEEVRTFWFNAAIEHFLIASNDTVLRREIVGMFGSLGTDLTLKIIGKKLEQSDNARLKDKLQEILSQLLRD